MIDSNRIINEKNKELIEDEQKSDKSINNNLYWREMYDELESQMKQMMEMTLELLDNNNVANNTQLDTVFIDDKQIKQLKKEIRQYQLFEHRIKVTWLGRLTLKYISFKKTIRKLIK